MQQWLFVSIWMLLVHEAFLFVIPSYTAKSKHQRFIGFTRFSSNTNDYYRQLEQENKEAALVEALFREDSSSTMMEVSVIGQGRLPVNTSISLIPDQIVLFLAATENPTKKVSSLIVPLNSLNQLKLVSFAQAKRPLSKSVLLPLNSLLVNRDNALFDNLPWSSWSIDPQKRNRDAAGNPIFDKFHLGKRDAYNRFMGKDWQGRSLALGNLALRLKYMLESDDKQLERQTVDLEESRTSLAIRVMELQIREIQMDLAETNSQIAIAKSNSENHTIGEKKVTEFEANKEELQESLKSMERDLNAIRSDNSSKNMSSKVSKILEQVAKWSTNDGKNAAPYRGAMGYSPMLDSKNDIDDSLLPYTSPYDLLKEILQDQLNAKVIGCVLENTSLLRGNTVLGGAIVLQRITPTATKTIMGEEVKYQDQDEDFGNDNVKGGEMLVVECDPDESIGISLAYDVPLRVDSTLFDGNSVMSESHQRPRDTQSSRQHIIETLPVWKPVVKLSLQVEGEKQGSMNLSPISIPGDFNNMPSESKALFPVDSPIKSLDEYDELSNEDKAKVLLEMSNFSGRLPRPRLVRQSKSNPLDDLLLPMIDETVRRQYLIRDAEQKGDKERVEELKASKSTRQMAIERAEAARNSGKDDLADRWDSESDFLESLRADITQDEGSYSRFLDKDDWYERERQATAKRAKKSSFGTLLDGIE